MQNYGSTKTYVMRDGKKHLNKINWNLNYDGDHVLGKVYVKNDKNRKQYDISLNNNDIARLFNINAVNKPIDNRLQDDFFQNYSDMNEDSEYSSEDEDKEEDQFLPMHLTPMPSSPNYDMNEFIEPMSAMVYRRNPTLRRRIKFRIVPMNNRSMRRKPLRKPIRVTPYPMKTRKRPINRRSLTSINK